MHPNTRLKDHPASGGWTGTAGASFDLKTPALQDLNTMIPPDSGIHLDVAKAINHAGQIAAYGTVGRQTHAFLLAPEHNVQ